MQTTHNKTLLRLEPDTFRITLRSSVTAANFLLLLTFKRQLSLSWTRTPILLPYLNSWPAEFRRTCLVVRMCMSYSSPITDNLVCKTNATLLCHPAEQSYTRKCRMTTVNNKTCLSNLNALDLSVMWFTLLCKDTAYGVAMCVCPTVYPSLVINLEPDNGFELNLT
jgi:hypothetical protein